MAVKIINQPMAAQSTRFRLSNPNERLCPLCMNNFTTEKACADCASSIAQSFPKHHVLNIKMHLLKAVLDGDKTFGICKNDRDFRVNDTLELVSGEIVSPCYSITYVTNYEQQSNYVVFSFAPVQAASL